MQQSLVTVPVQGKDNHTQYRRVGVMFQNHNRQTGEVYYRLVLDFPVGATEMLAFAPMAQEAAATAVIEDPAPEATGADASASDAATAGGRG
ncbi:hypothetical protein [Tateyamaria sp.]|uniref:hypothetical protein n=1 Tax=Tateyamaria sp. TaxID=1929288 RepID=UPI003B220658